MLLCHITYTYPHAHTHTANSTLVGKVDAANLQCQSPTEICQACFKAYPNVVWLAWLKCIYPEEHSQKPNVTVAVDLSHTQLVEVRQPPSILTDPRVPALCHQKAQGNCPTGERCRYAHSKEEQNYWKWEIAKKLYEKNVRQSCQ